jgi:hypothetical protein
MRGRDWFGWAALAVAIMPWLVACALVASRMGALPSIPVDSNLLFKFLLVNALAATYAGIFANVFLRTRTSKPGCVAAILGLLFLFTGLGIVGLILGR